MLGLQDNIIREKKITLATSERMQCLCFSLNMCVFFLQGSSEAQPVLQKEKAPAHTAPPTGAVHLPHQLQRHPAGVPARRPTMPAPGCVQSEREPRDGKGKKNKTTFKDSVNLKALLQPWFVLHISNPMRQFSKEFHKSAYLALCSQPPTKTDLIVGTFPCRRCNKLTVLASYQT